jgi:molecular chaperone GrpE
MTGEHPAGTDNPLDPAIQSDTIPFPSGADPVAALNAENVALAQQVSEAKDRALRALAEMENLRRRTEREVADAKVYGVTSFARDLLNVADNLRRAMDVVPVDLKSSEDAGVKGFLDGLDLTERELLKVLGKQGVKRLDPKGQKFDPNLHQAMFEIPDASVPNGTVVQVVQDGFTIGERVLRPALVGVAKGGPKPGAEAPPTEATGS